jgi:hypothetical protein
LPAAKRRAAQDGKRLFEEEKERRDIMRRICLL